MTILRNLLLLSCSLALMACSAVSLPRERYWRLELPVPAGGELPRGGVLMVNDLQLANALQGDCLLVTNGTAEIAQLELEHWIAPLDRLVTDAVVLGLSRTRMFALVKGAGDPGHHDHSLHGRVVDFGLHRDAQGMQAQVVCQFWLEDRDGLLFQDEFRASVPIAAISAAAGVAAMSSALQQVLDQLTGRMRAAKVFDRTMDSAPVK